MRTMDKATLRWLATQYGSQIDRDNFGWLLQEFGADRTNAQHSNGVTVTRHWLPTGMVLTEHAGMWETFYFATQAEARA